MKTTFNFVSVFSSVSDLSLLVASAPGATEHLALFQLTSVYCKFLRKKKKVIDICEIE